MEIELELKIAGQEIELKLGGWRLFAIFLGLAVLVLKRPNLSQLRERVQSSWPER